jgi:hypothetical protein
MADHHCAIAVATAARPKEGQCRRKQRGAPSPGENFPVRRDLHPACSVDMSEPHVNNARIWT